MFIAGRFISSCCCAETTMLCCAVPTGPTSFSPATTAKPWENLYYAVEVPGAFIIAKMFHDSNCQVYQLNGVVQQTHALRTSPARMVYAPGSRIGLRFTELSHACVCPHAGVFKTIHLTSFSFNQPMSKNEEQYLWLEQELKKVSIGL
jgi:hypothetical protein